MNGDQLEQYLEGMELSKTSVIYTLETTKREESIDIFIFSIVILLFDLLNQVEKKLEKRPSDLQPISIDGLVDYSTKCNITPCFEHSVLSSSVLSNSVSSSSVLSAVF